MASKRLFGIPAAMPAPQYFAPEFNASVAGHTCIHILHLTSSKDHVTDVNPYGVTFTKPLCLFPILFNVFAADGDTLTEFLELEQKIGKKFLKKHRRDYDPRQFAEDLPAHEKHRVAFYSMPSLYSLN